jgi:Ulp1 family protease
VDIYSQTKSELNLEDWTIQYITKIPKQENANDCGIFMIKYIKALKDGNGSNFITKEFNIEKSRVNLKKKLVYLLNH